MLGGDQWMLILDLLLHSERLSLSKVSTKFHLLHLRWCQRQTIILQRQCRFLDHFHPHHVTEILQSPTTRIVCQPNFQHNEIDKYTKHALGAMQVKKSDRNRDDVKSFIISLLKRDLEEAIPQVCPLMILHHNALMIINDRRELYVDGKCVMEDVQDVHINVNHDQWVNITARDKIYHLTNGKCVLYKDKARVTLVSGQFRVLNDHLIKDNYGNRIFIPDRILVFCYGGIWDGDTFIFLVTTEGKGGRASFVFVLGDNQIIECYPIPVVKEAIALKGAFIVVLQDGAMKLISCELYFGVEEKITQTTIKEKCEHIYLAQTYVRMEGFDYLLMFARTEDEIYSFLFPHYSGFHIKRYGPLWIESKPVLPVIMTITTASAKYIWTC